MPLFTALASHALIGTLGVAGPPLIDVVRTSELPPAPYSGTNLTTHYGLAVARQGDRIDVGGRAHITTHLRIDGDWRLASTYVLSPIAPFTPYCGTSIARAGSTLYAGAGRMPGVVPTANGLQFMSDIARFNIEPNGSLTLVGALGIGPAGTVVTDGSTLVAPLLNGTSPVFPGASGAVAWQLDAVGAPGPPVLVPLDADCTAAAVSGDWMVLGAPTYDYFGLPESGGAAIFRRSRSGAWLLHQWIFSPEPAGPPPGDRFGFAVAIDGDRAAIGAPDDDGDQFAIAGRVTIFAKGPDDVWTVESTVSGWKQWSYAGMSVALAGDLLAIGAPGGSLNDGAAGSARLYRLGSVGSGAPQLVLEVLPHDDEPNVGRSVTIAEGTLYVGAGPRDPQNGSSFPETTDAGTVFIVDLATALADCNGNGTPDAIDLASGASDDCNADRIPDECTPTDCDANGVADVCDVMQPRATIGDWVYAYEAGTYTAETLLRIETLTVPPMASGVLTSLEADVGQVSIAGAVSMGVWRDPNQDGYPDDAELVRLVALGNLGASAATSRIDLPPTPVGGPGDRFFVGIAISGGRIALGYRQSAVWHGASFYESAPVGTFSFTDLSANGPIHASSYVNGNGYDIEVAARFRAVSDVDEDGVPDGCSCPTDLNRDGVTDARDLELLLGAWGTATSEGLDIDGDGFVGALDLAVLLAQWGACP